MIALLSALGCTGAPTDDDDDGGFDFGPPYTPYSTLGSVDTATPPGDTDTTPVDPGGLHGEVPPAPLPPPTFTAVAMTGEDRTQADLLGAPTVMWFYPAAFTGG
jgi:hypothetical protein